MWIIQSEIGSVRYFWIPNFGDAYVVGDDGSVWSRYKGIGKNCYLSDDWTRLSPTSDKDGYLIAVLRFNGNSYTKKVHQLVCEAVYGPCPLGMEVCHNDNNPSHNDYWNLRYDTDKGNQADRVIYGTDHNGEKSPNAKSTWIKTGEIREKYASGHYSYRRLGLEYGMCAGNVYRIVKNLMWKEEKNTS